MDNPNFPDGDVLVLDIEKLFEAFPGFVDDSDVNGADLVDYIVDALVDQGFLEGGD